MWPSEATATVTYDIANVALIVSLVVGVIATCLVVWMGSVKDGYLRRSLASVNQEAAEATERAASANKQAAEAQLALEKYKAPRTIEQTERAAFVRALQPSSGQEYMLSVANGQEAANLVCLLDDLLKKAGWKRFDDHPNQIITITVATDCGRLGVNALSDVHVRVALQRTNATRAAADSLLQALAAAGITVHPGQDPMNVPNDQVVLVMVGAKQ